MKVEILERRRVTTPLGIRFWDAAMDRPVTSGLRVTARPENLAKPVAAAQPTRSGIYAFHHLPNLRDFEYADHDFGPDMPAPATKRYVVRVEDGLGRFLPAAFVVSAPFAGIFPAGHLIQSPPAPIGFDLFSSVTRRLPGGFAEVHATLLDVSRNPPVPAAHVVLEISVGPQQHYHGVSDAAGKAVVCFPYPPITIVLAQSPPSGTMIALSEQTWNVRVRLRYSPAAVMRLTGVPEPNLRTILEQPLGVAFPDPGAAGVSEFEQKIFFGKPTFLRTSGQPELRISPTGSPP